MTTPNISNRRKHPRAKFRNQIHAYPVRESKSGNIFEVQKDPLAVKTIDLSEAGIRLEWGISKPLNPILKIKIEVNNNESVDAFSRLVWSSEKFTGYKFILLDPGEEKSIRDFVNQLT